MRRRSTAALASLVAVALSAAALAGSETPPEGPPWLRDFAQAREQGIRTGTPVFVYLTKTY